MVKANAREVARMNHKALRRTAGARVGGGLLVPLLACVMLAACTPATGVQVFTGMADASAAEPVGWPYFVVATDEENILYVYDATAGGGPVDWLDLRAPLDRTGEGREADIEASAAAGNRIYWAGSHGRNKNGKWREDRHAFFATDLVQGPDGSRRLVLAGTPSNQVLRAIVAHPRAEAMGLPAATRFDLVDAPKSERAHLAPKVEGVNLEGMATWPPGATPAEASLLLGFRNPLVPADGGMHAVVAVLSNPDAVVGESATPVISGLEAIDLGGLAIRSMATSPGHEGVQIVAGPVDGDGPYRLYSWAGPGSIPRPESEITPAGSGYTIEGMLAFEGRPGWFVVSDDGSVEVPIQDPAECMPGELLGNGRCPNKYLTDPAARKFRGFFIHP